MLFLLDRDTLDSSTPHQSAVITVKQIEVVFTIFEQANFVPYGVLHWLKQRFIDTFICQVQEQKYKSFDE